MRKKPEPSHSDIFMARKIYKRFFEIEEKYMENGEISLKFMKRFLDDIFSIFLGSINRLHEVLMRLMICIQP